MDKLEDFIRENRSRLDIYEPPEGNWESIPGRRFPAKRTRLILFSAVAALIILAGLAILFRSQSSHGLNKTSNAAAAQQELGETERFYNSLYHDLYREARPLLTGQPDVIREIDDGAARIDSICADLKKDLKDNISNQDVIEALIRNYRIKLQLLEDMLEIVKQNETNKKTGSHEL